MLIKYTFSSTFHQTEYIHRFHSPYPLPLLHMYHKNNYITSNLFKFFFPCLLVYKTKNSIQFLCYIVARNLIPIICTNLHTLTQNKVTNQLFLYGQTKFTSTFYMITGTWMHESNTWCNIEVSKAWYLNIYLTIRYTSTLNCWQKYVLIAVFIWLSSVQQTSIPFMIQGYEHLDIFYIEYTCLDLL